MKRLLGFASRLLLGATPLLAQAGQPASGWIAGVRGGATVSAVDSDSLDRELGARGHSVATDVDRRDSAVVLSLDYRLNSLTSLEVSVGALGSYEADATGSSPDPAQLSEDLVDLKPAGGRFIGFGVRQDLPLVGDKLVLTTRGAVIGWRQESTVSNGVSSQRFRDQDLGWMLGVATTYLATPAVGISLGGDWYDQGSHGSLGLLHAGAEYRF